MRKRSKHFADITESCRWWDCSMEGIAEWTFEGRSEPKADKSIGREVGTDGNRNRYLAAYMLVYG